ncbi:Kinesin light chain [Metarhizium anisopliae]|nr:Kinesin light chain [Metarhizium anisopliae]
MAVDRKNLGSQVKENYGMINNLYPTSLDNFFHHPQTRQRPPTFTDVVRLIPYPRNEDLVHRHLIDELNNLLPRTSEFNSAALWGLGGSGFTPDWYRKTQIALDYAYRRCDEGECHVFWVNAATEASFARDYRTIGKKLGVDERPDGEDLLDAVCSRIEALPRWVVVLDKADDLTLFGVRRLKETINESLHRYIPKASGGTVLWTTCDAHIAGTLVGARRGVEVSSMTHTEATKLLASARNKSPTAEEVGIDALLEELQWLPLAISQAGAYMRRRSMTVKKYLSLLVQDKTRWDVLKTSEFDRHRPDVVNSVLETGRISMELIRRESEMAYKIMHVIAYLDNQDLPYELLLVASKHLTGNEERAREATELELQEALTRLTEFSLLSMRQKDDGEQMYKLSKLVQDAIRYGLSLGAGDNETQYPTLALQIMDDIFPVPKQESWARGEQYISHVIRVGECAEVCGEQIKTSALLSRASEFLHYRGRWREKEYVDRRALDLRRETLGEKHPDTITSMAALATGYHKQGRYNEAKALQYQALHLRQQVLGEKHPDTIQSMGNLASIYCQQGRYDEAETLENKVLDLRREVLGQKHPDTVSSMGDLASTYYRQGRYREAETLENEVLDLRREVLGQKHPDTISSMWNLAAIHYQQR